jgi:putative inorganic carbon (hco3(-)) transporter
MTPFGDTPIAPPTGLAQQPRRRRLLSQSAVATPTNLLALRFGEIWRFMTTQNFAFWAMCAYLFVEYVRPQQLFGPVYGAPLGQIVLAAAVLAQLASGKLLRIVGPGSVLMLVFTGVILASSFAAYNPSVSWDGMREWMSWVLIFFLIANIVDTQAKFIVFALIWMLCHYYMSQGGAKQFALRGFTFKSWGVVGAPGWFQNSGEFGIAMCMFTVVSWHFYLAARKHLTLLRKAFVLGMPLTAILGVMASSSRGAVVALGAAGVSTLLRSKHRFRALIGLTLAAGIFWMALPAEQKARFSEAGGDATSISRKTYWNIGLQITRTHPALGVGYNNWLVYYRNTFPEEVNSFYGVQLSHNIFIQCMAELGLVGLAAFLAMIVGTFTINYQTRKRALASTGPPPLFIVHMAHALDGAMLCYLVAGFFVTVLYYPFFWINLAMTVALSQVARENDSAERRRPRARAHVSAKPGPGSATRNT